MAEQIPSADRVAGARLLLQSVVVPALNAQARAAGVDLYTGVQQAIDANVSWRDVVSHPGFQNFMAGPLGSIVRTLADSLSDLAEMRPGETVGGSAQWLLETAAGMEFETSSGVVPGWVLYGAVVNKGQQGKDWFVQLVAQMYSWFRAGMPT